MTALMSGRKNQVPTVLKSQPGEPIFYGHRMSHVSTRKEALQKAMDFLIWMRTMSLQGAINQPGAKCSWILPHISKMKCGGPTSSNFQALPSLLFQQRCLPGAQPDVMGKFANVNSSRSTTEDANEFIIRPLLELGLSLLKTSDICSSALAGSYIKGQSSTIETASTAGI